MDLSIRQLVAVARPDSAGRWARVEPAGSWRERCQAAVEYLQQALSETANKSAAQLAAYVAEWFSSRDKPPHLAALLASYERCRAAAETAALGEIESQLAQLALIYGVTTGFGNNRHVPIRDEAAMHQMQLNLLRSHACGVGPPLPVEIVRATMLLRIRTFVQGCSAVRPEVVLLLCEMLNRAVHPCMPSQGSVGCSGDLCPLAHLALVLIGEGQAALGARAVAAPDGPYADGAAALRAAGLAPLTTLYPKEALALINGATVSAAAAALAAHDAGILLDTADLCAAMSLQALRGATRAYEPAVHRLRRHDGQAEAARRILQLATPSPLLDSSRDVQDNYSLRCAPAVHGAARTAIAHVTSVIEQEINAVTDNPLILPGASTPPGGAATTGLPGRDPLDAFAACLWHAYPAGNFHGEPVGMVADYLKIAVAELASISERRTQYLLDPHHNRGLPANLWPDRGTSGLNSGLMIAQYTAAALVSENKVLAHPASVDSIPTSSNAEDHNAMSLTAARHARQVVENAFGVVAIELLAAVQALALRIQELGGDRSVVSPAARAAMLRVLEALGVADATSLPPPIAGRDAWLAPIVDRVRRLADRGDLLAARE